MWYCKIFLLSAFFAVAESQACATWDHIVFTRQWSQAVCLQNLRSGLKDCCYIPAGINDWTIHGAWPSRGTEKEPHNCSDCAGTFDPTKITGLETALNKTWPTLYPGPDAYHKFWEHEWNKHGRCGVIIPPLEDEYHYFNTTMDLHQRYSIDQILRRSAIVPSDTNLYPIKAYLAALKHGLGADPVIQCFHDKVMKKQYVVQIEFCLSKNLEPISCPDKQGIINSTEMCIQNMPLSYPVIQADTGFPKDCEKVNHTLYFLSAQQAEMLPEIL